MIGRSEQERQRRRLAVLVAVLSIAAVGGGVAVSAESHRHTNPATLTAAGGGRSTSVTKPVTSTTAPPQVTTSVVSPATGLTSTTSAPGTSSATTTSRPGLHAVPHAPSPPALELVDGTYEGSEQFTFTTPQCAEMDHNMAATFHLSRGQAWSFRTHYCGTITDGNLWSGVGTFTFETPDGATLHGHFTDAARLPTSGEPYTLQITGGTGRYAAAIGSCDLTTHLTAGPFGHQLQSGTFACRISSGSAAHSMT